MATPALSRRRVMAASVAALSSTIFHTERLRAELAADGPITIAFIGDSMVDGLWGGMERLVTREACLATRVKLMRFGENGTGLTRPARFDWISRAKAIVFERKPTLSLISLGLNDRQSILDGKARFDLGTAAWRKRYGELVVSLAQASAGSKAGAIWIGIPVLRDTVSQDDAATKNTIVAEALDALKDPRIRYVAPWRQSASGLDTFELYGPDVSGARVQIRANDGIHFTAAGYDLVDRYVMSAVIDHLRVQGISLAYPCPT